MKPLWSTPLADEMSAYDLTVTGTIPDELAGTYLRNGGNALPGQPSHEFAAQGMLHGIRLARGRAAWYRNRWVRTPLLDGARPYRPDGSHDLTAGTANTSVLAFANKLFALVESSLPFEISDELATTGPFDFAGKLATPMTAHPKRDVASGELHFFGYDFRPPFVTYHVAAENGQLVRSMPVEVPAPTMMHDFALTEHHVIWLDQPVVFDRALAKRGAMPFRWSEDYPARLGVMDRATSELRWFGVSSGYAFHVANAYELQRSIVLEAVRYDRAAFEATWEVLGAPPSGAGAGDDGAHLYRWEIDLCANTVREEQLDTAPIEFPTIDPARTGRPHLATYAVTMPRFAAQGAELIKYVRGERSSYRFDAGWVPGEMVFVTRHAPRGEDHGWLMGIATHATEDRARLVIHDARSLAPVAEITLPRRVPVGFHGAWIPR